MRINLNIRAVYNLQYFSLRLFSCLLYIYTISARFDPKPPNKGENMGKAFEISVWKPHPGKRADFMKNRAEVAAIFKDACVSDIKVLEGVAGKDVGNIVLIQTFKNLTDNGKVNDAIGDNAKMKVWMKRHAKDNFAALVSHDLYAEA